MDPTIHSSIVQHRFWGFPAERCLELWRRRARPGPLTWQLGGPKILGRGSLDVCTFLAGKLESSESSERPKEEVLQNMKVWYAQSVVFLGLNRLSSTPLLAC